MSSRLNSVPLIVEPYPSDYDGYRFLTLIQYRDNKILTIVDDTTDKLIRAYVLDNCEACKVNKEILIRVAIEWFEINDGKYPISFEFSKLGLTEAVSPVYHTFNKDYVTRAIGPMPAFNMNKAPTVKRRRRRVLSPAISTL